MPINLKINTDFIVENLNTIQKMVGNTECAPVLKANAYGLDQELITREILKNTQVTKIFVATTTEGMNARKSLGQADVDIFVLEGLTKSLAAHDRYKKYALSPVLLSPEEIITWTEMGLKNVKYAIQVNIGMNRLGLNIQSLAGIRETGISPDIILGHLSSADEPKSLENQRERAVFLKACEYFPKAKRSLSASAGIFLGKDYHFDLVRPGISLYGPFMATQEVENKLKNAISIDLQVLQKHTLSKGEKVGYNGTWIAEKETSVATINIGYADGLSTYWSQTGSLNFYHPKTESFYPVIGRISMDSTIIKLDDDLAKKVSIGDQVILIDQHRNFAKLAQDIKTCPHEILTSIGNGPRVLKKYIH